MGCFLQIANLPHDRTRDLPISFLTGLGLAFVSTGATADDTLALSESLYALSGPEGGAAALGASNPWRFSVGMGVVNMPKFPGGSGTKWEAVPVVSASYDRFFIGANPDAASLLSLGAYLYRDSNWRVGAAITYDFLEPRSESEDPRLNGLGDVERTAHAEVFVVYTYIFVTARASVLTDIAGNDRGTVATFDLMGKYEPVAGLMLTAGPGLTWGSSKYNETYFGVNSEQSARSGLPPFAAGSGLNEFRFSAGAAYRFAAHWNVGASITAAWLHGDATDSPITEKTNQMTYGLFASYLF